MRVWGLGSWPGCAAACHRLPQKSSLSAKYRIVHAKPGDGRTANVTERQQSQVVVAPGEMLIPIIAAWIEQSDFAIAQRVAAGDEVILQAVAVGTGRGQVLGVVDILDRISRETAPSPRSRDNVIDLKLPMRDTAVFAAIASPSLDCLFLLF